MFLHLDDIVTNKFYLPTTVNDLTNQVKSDIMQQMASSQIEIEGVDSRSKIQLHSTIQEDITISIF